MHAIDHRLRQLCIRGLGLNFLVFALFDEFSVAGCSDLCYLLDALVFALIQKHALRIFLIGHSKTQIQRHINADAPHLSGSAFAITLYVVHMLSVTANSIIFNIRECQLPILSSDGHPPSSANSPKKKLSQANTACFLADE